MNDQPQALRYGTFSLAFGIGCLITFMISLNGQLAQAVGPSFSLLVIHMAGGSAVIIALIARHLRGIPFLLSASPLPRLYYTGGILGVLMVFGNNTCFVAIGVSVTMAAGIFGQTAGSILIDATGSFGMRRYRFAPSKFIGLGIILAGVALMVNSWQLDLLYLVLALFIGGVTILQMTINSRVAAVHGLMPGVGINYLGGILASLAAVLILGIPLASSFSNLSSVPLHWVVGGGLFGFVIVSGANTILPKIPTFYSSLLMFLGQIASAITVDALLLGIFSYQRILGAALILVGIIANMQADRKGALEPVRLS